MIIPNGTIEFITNAPGGLDANGYPVQSGKTYGPEVPCQYIANNRNTLGRTNGENFIRASYQILIEWLDFSSLGKTERLRLKSRSGNEIGEYPVLNIEPLDAVCQLRILV